MSGKFRGGYVGKTLNDGVGEKRGRVKNKRVVQKISVGEGVRQDILLLCGGRVCQESSGTKNEETSGKGDGAVVASRHIKRTK